MNPQVTAIAIAIANLIFSGFSILAGIRGRKESSRRFWVLTVFVGGGLIVVAGLSFYISGKVPAPLGPQIMSSAKDEAAIIRTIGDAQLFETSVYSKPKDFDKFVPRFDQYWVPESEGGLQIARMRQTALREVAENYRYGNQAKLLRFEPMHVWVYAPGDSAQAVTREQYYVPKFDYRSGMHVQPQRDTVGPLCVLYSLRKLHGRWLIQVDDSPHTPVNFPNPVNPPLAAPPG
jgi:hypothetical protein